MTFQQLQLEVIDTWLDPETTKLAQVKNWLNISESKVWNLDDWTFRHVHGATLSVLNGNSAPTMPADFDASEALYDASQNQIVYLDPIDWRDSFESSTGTGPADAYTVMNGQIYIGPIPSANQTLTLDYTRRVSHLNAGGSVVAGTMSLATDVPLWASEYHYVLVLEASILAKQLKGDQTWQELVPQRDEIVHAMRDSMVGSVIDERPMVAGSWPGDRYFSGSWYG